MADGIKINDAAVEIAPEDLQALLSKRASAVKVSRLDLAASQEAVNALLSSTAPAPAAPGAPPSVQIEEGRLRLTLEREGVPFSLDLQTGALRLEFGADGLRLVTE